MSVKPSANSRSIRIGILLIADSKAAINQSMFKLTTERNYEVHELNLLTK